LTDRAPFTQAVPATVHVDEPSERGKLLPEELAGLICEHLQ